ncbi:glycosyltransferase [Candidatus Collierbacteria bacterium]|nr:glycosyltransferase [Candidatus Collierbacteria bacterium]
MKILFIAPYPPNPIRTRLRNFAIGLADRGHFVDIIAPYSSSAEIIGMEDLQKNNRIRQYLVKDFSVLRQLRTTLSVFDGKPFQQHYFVSKSLKILILQLLKNHRYDCIHVETFKVANSVSGDLGLNNLIPIIIDAVDCFSDLYKQFAGTVESSIWKKIYAMESKRVLAFEKQRLNKFRYVITSTNHEALLLKKISGIKRIASIENGVDLTLFPPSPSFKNFNCKREPTIAFSGKISYIANSTAVIYFYKKIFPFIAEQFPNIKFKIIGASPPKTILNLAKDNRIEITGYVENLANSFNDVHVVVCPLIMGAGIHNKLMEAMALAKPVVATSLSCKNFNFKSGKELIIADKEIDFAESVVNLLRNPDLCQAIGFTARSYIEKHFRWEDKIEKLEKIYRGSIASTR